MVVPRAGPGQSGAPPIEQSLSMIRRPQLASLPPALLALLPAPSSAQDYDTGVPSAVTVSGQVAGVSDYRFRGLTQSDGDPAAQATVTVTHESGLSAGVFVSTVAGRDPGDSLAGAGGVEADLFATYSRTLASGLKGEVGATYYVYPDNRSGRNTDYFEPYAALAYDLGPAQARLSAAYAPSGQSALQDRDRLYVAGDLRVGVPTTPVTLLGHVGRSSGAPGLVRALGRERDYVDWSAGFEATQGPVVIGARYVDTHVSDRVGLANGVGADATVVGSISLRF